jgi:iron complex transport system substrate-binding protein
MRARTIVHACTMLALGCGRAPDRPAAARAVVDGLGRTVRLPARVERVISLAPSSTEILYAVGAGARLVGVDRYSDFPSEAAKLERVGADIDPSLERIVALRPDLVFTATSANNQRTAEALERLGIPVYVSAAERLDEILADTGRIAEAVGEREAGARLVRVLRGRLAAVAARVHALPATRALVLVWSDPLIVAGRGSHVDDLVRAAGGENAAGDSPQAYPTYSVERVLARAPDVLVVGTHSDGAADPAARLAARFPGLAAVKGGRVHALPGELLFRPGPRVVDGVELLAKVLHP